MYVKLHQGMMNHIAQIRSIGGNTPIREQVYTSIRYPSMSSAVPYERIFQCKYKMMSCGFLIPGHESVKFKVDTSTIPDGGEGFHILENGEEHQEVCTYGGCTRCLRCHRDLYVLGDNPLECR
jgi:hypothetical protein